MHRPATGTPQVSYVLCADTLQVGGPVAAADVEFLQAIATAISPGKKPLPLRPQPGAGFVGSPKKQLGKIYIVEAAGGIDKDPRDGHRCVAVAAAAQPGPPRATASALPGGGGGV